MANSFLTVPVLNQPFCNNGTKNTIPNTVDQTQGLASLSTGFPPITSQRIADGGKPPKRADFNGAFNMISQRDYNQQIGGVEVFRQDVSAAIGGYPKDAILWFKPEADELPFMIVSLEDNNTNTPTGLDTDTHWKKMSFGGGSSLPLGFHFWSDHELDDVSYLRADTFSWQPKTGYEEFYNLLVDQYNDESSTTETDQGITYKLTPKKYKIADVSQMQAIADRYDSTGKSWYYIIDEENERFKLPRSKYNSYISQIDVKGNGNALRLTVGASTSNANQFHTHSGYGADFWAIYSGTTIDGAVKLAETNSGIIAELPTDENMLLYFYCGRYSQSAIEQTAGLNASLFNNKLDLDIGNATQSTKDAIIHWGTPDYSAGITIGTNANFIPPKTGVISIWATEASNASRYQVIDKTSSNAVLLYTAVGLYVAGTGSGQCIVEKDHAYDVTAIGGNSVYYPYKGA